MLTEDLLLEDLLSSHGDTVRFDTMAFIYGFILNSDFGFFFGLGAFVLLLLENEGTTIPSVFQKFAQQLINVLLKINQKLYS